MRQYEKVLGQEAELEATEMEKEQEEVGGGGVGWGSSRDLGGGW